MPIQLNPHQSQFAHISAKSPTVYLKPDQAVDRSQVVVKTRDATTLHKEQALAKEKRVERVGGQADLTYVRHQIEAVPVRDVQAQSAKMTTAESIKDWGVWLLKGAGQGIKYGAEVGVKTAWGLLTLPVRPAINLYKNHLIVKALETEATLQKNRSKELFTLAQTIATQFNLGMQDPNASPEIQRAHETVGQLLDQATKYERAGNALGIEANKQDVIAKYKNYLHRFRKSEDLMESAQSVSYGVSGAKGVSNVVLASSANEATKATLTSTTQALGVAGGAVSTFMEMEDLVKTSASLRQSLHARKKAMLVIMSPEQRETKAQEYDNRINEINNRNAIVKLFAGTGQRKIDLLQAKADQLRAMNMHGVSPKEKAIADQVILRTDATYQKVKLAKHVLGVVSGVTTTVVAGLIVGGVLAAGLATPVGWAVLGIGAVALAGSLSLHLYSTYKNSRRSSKVLEVEKARAQVEYKQQALKEDLGTVTKDINGLQEQREHLDKKTTLLDRILNKGYQPSLQEKQTFELESYFEVGMGTPKKDKLRELRGLTHQKLTATEFELAPLQKEKESIQNNIQMLDELAQRNELQLLAISPHRAGQEILNGYRQGDPTMVFIAEKVMGVPPHAKDLPDSMALAYFSSIPLNLPG